MPSIRLPRSLIRVSWAKAIASLHELAGAINGFVESKRVEKEKRRNSKSQKGR